ncbi:uncharacterized protein LOC143230242 isoform X1 [Tachypleus tridentatus]|uniref:uncharacterized protein LOC143230242 isoform X1 n=1 Tax=Tachypleus tridentatus TaxID=6853 RepID=UPI003FD1D473
MLGCTILRMVLIVMIVQLPTTRGDMESCLSKEMSPYEEKQVPLVLVKQLNKARNLFDIVHLCHGNKNGWKVLFMYAFRRFLDNISSSEPTLRLEIDRPTSRTSTTSSGNISGQNLLSIDHNATCHPRPVPFQVPQPSDPASIFYPACVELHRCVGCCGHSQLTCTATSVKNVSRQVIELSLFPETGITKIKSLSFEEHTSCVCQCKTKPEDCSTSQQYKEDSCQCVCPFLQSCPEHQSWNTTLCACVCKEVQYCSSGLYFNTDVCRCEHA